MTSLGSRPLQPLGAEVSAPPLLRCLGEVNGVSRGAVGIFKPSLTRCQQNQTWKQMAMARRACALAGESLVPGVLGRAGWCV